MNNIFSLEILETADDKSRKLIYKYWELENSEKAIFKFNLSSLRTEFNDLQCKSFEKIHSKIEDVSYLYETKKKCSCCGDRIKILNRKELRNYVKNPKTICDLCIKNENKIKIDTSVEHIATYIDELYSVQPTRKLSDLTYIESVFLDFIIKKGLLNENGLIHLDYNFSSLDLSIFEDLNADRFIIDISVPSELCLKSMASIDFLLKNKREMSSTKFKFCLSLISAFPESGLYINPAILALRMNIEELTKNKSIQFSDFEEIERFLVDFLVTQLIIEKTKNCSKYSVYFEINEATKECMENLIRKISFPTSVRLVKRVIEKLAAELHANVKRRIKLVNKFNASLKNLTNYVIENSEYPTHSIQNEGLLGNDFLSYVSNEIVNNNDIFYQKPANEVLKIWFKALSLDQAAT